MNQKEPANRLSSQWIDLAAEKLGGKVLFATDDFFAEKENLIKPGRGIFIPDKYTENGKWMDGWESRRKRTPGHDWAVLELATPGVIKGFDIDTNHFTGNHPSNASVAAAWIDGAADNSSAYWEQVDWKELLAKDNAALNPGSQHLYDIDNDQPFTHVRLNIFPDGGVARFRVYGYVSKDWESVASAEVLDLASAVNGARAIDCNDMYFSDMSNLLNPGRGVNMGDGWETKRNRTPNNVDWVVIKLATPGTVQKVLVDTCHFKGNYPDSCALDYCHAPNDDLSSATWRPLMEQQKLQADHEHYFESEVQEHEAITHVRLKIYPDGGISRLRLFGCKC